MALPNSMEALLARIWEEGYNAGFNDGISDSYVDQQAINPYKQHS